METREQKIERLKKEITELRKSKTRIMEGYIFKIKQLEQQLKELEDDGRNSKN